MYDFLCLMPHATGSVSFLHYLNLHREMHVASFQSIGTSVERLEAYEANFRPFFKHLGVSAKNYHDPDWPNTLLSTCSRRLLVQAVRDPIGCLVSQINNARQISALREILGIPYEAKSVDEEITWAVEGYISHQRAEQAYHAASFDEHIIVDMSEIMPDTVKGTLDRLWTKICGDADDSNIITPASLFVDHGSIYLRFIREYGKLNIKIGSVQLEIIPKSDGELELERYKPVLNEYFAYDLNVHTFPDIGAYLPTLQMSGALHICVPSVDWNAIHPKLRPKILEEIIPAFEDNMQALNQALVKLMRLTPFTANDFNSSQRETLKRFIQDDVERFESRHPDVVGKWAATEDFLN